MAAEIIGYIAAPTGAGADAVRGWWTRGGKPRWYPTRASALKRCAAIERAGWRDGGRGRDSYVVAVVRDGDSFFVTAGKAAAGGTGLALDGKATLQVGCSLHSEDAVIWLRSRSPRWLKQHGLPKSL